MVAVFEGTSSSDYIVGTVEDEVFYTGGGYDSVLTGGGNNVVFGGVGSLTGTGGSGNDVFFGSSYGGNQFKDSGGRNVFYGAYGGGWADILSYAAATSGITVNAIDAYWSYVIKNTTSLDVAFYMDKVIGTSYNDVFYGGAAWDNFNGGGGNDTLYGAAGDDTLDGSGGDDTLYGDDGDDSLWGNTGNDTIYGGNGTDSLSGGDGNDILYGGAGYDTLSGNAGDDVLVGGPADNKYLGGTGKDLFVLDKGAQFPAYFGADILDFSGASPVGRTAEGDQIKFLDHGDMTFESVMAKFTQVGDDAVYRDGANVIKLIGYHVSWLTADDFIFA